MVCVLDFKRDVGLWHGILCVSKTNPLVVVIILFVSRSVLESQFGNTCNWLSCLELQ